jgi:hypothetical protein
MRPSCPAPGNRYRAPDHVTIRGGGVRDTRLMGQLIVSMQMMYGCGSFAAELAGRGGGPVHLALVGAAPLASGVVNYRYRPTP